MYNAGNGQLFKESVSCSFFNKWQGGLVVCNLCFDRQLKVVLILWQGSSSKCRPTKYSFINQDIVKSYIIAKIKFMFMVSGHNFLHTIVSWFCQFFCLWWIVYMVDRVEPISPWSKTFSILNIVTKGSIGLPINVRCKLRIYQKVI